MNNLARDLTKREQFANQCLQSMLIAGKPVNFKEIIETVDGLLLELSKTEPIADEISKIFFTDKLSANNLKRGGVPQLWFDKEGDCQYPVKVTLFKSDEEIKYGI